MLFYLWIHSFSAIQNFIGIRSPSIWYKYKENKDQKMALVPVVLKPFIVYKTWRVSECLIFSSVRFTLFSPQQEFGKIY